MYRHRHSIGIGKGIGIGIGKGIGRGIGIGIGTGTCIGIGIGIGIDKGIGIGIGKGIGIGTDKGIGIGMPKMLFVLCFIALLTKKLQNHCVFEGEDEDLRCGRIGQPAQPGGGWLGAPRCQKCCFYSAF